MNFIFVSPNFPQTYWNFCDRLRAHGVNVLGLGDAPYDSLLPQLKAVLTDYYKVDNLGDYGQIFRAVAFFSFKYGKIDWLESNNENWLENDARLREDFNITTGVHPCDMLRFKSKAEQKKYFALAKVPTARQIQLGSEEDAAAFADLVGYPVFVKPEVGVGASMSYKLNSPEELHNFFVTKPDVPFVMEEFVTGDIYSYDAIVDSAGRPLFESSGHFPPSIADIANNRWDCPYEVLDRVPAQLRDRGRATLAAFGIRSRFVHFEFFCLSCDRPGLGVKGDYVGLETNMRPAGGYTPDMMNFAHSCDVYRIWADMVCLDREAAPAEDTPDDHFCAYYGRRDGDAYLHSRDEVFAVYGDRMAMQGRIPDAISDDLGNEMYVIHAGSQNEVDEFYSYMGARQDRG